MFSAFFGHYLLNKGAVSKEELNKVLSAQKKIRLQLGVLAINASYMTAEQVEEVHLLQASLDRRFGEIAIMKGYLNDVQVSNLLTQQKSEHLILAQALIEDKIMDIKTFEKEIVLYKKAHGLDDEQFEAIKKGDVDVVMTAFLAFENSSMSKFYIDFVTIFVKNIIRFVDSNVYIDRVEKVDSIMYEHLFKQDIKGPQKMFTAYAADDEALLDIASKHAEEEFSEIEEYPLDSASEFLNLTNGLFIVNMSNAGTEMELTVQEYIHNASLTPKNPVYRIPVHISSGTIYLHVGEA
jgi:hypothetical protein